MTDLGEFAAAHGQTLLRFAFLLTGGRAQDAEDLVQTVLLRLTAKDVATSDDLLAYARRSIVNEHRSRHRHHQVVGRVTPRLVETPRDPALAREVVDRVALLDALAELGERERAVLVLRYYEDLPDAEIAEILDCSRPTVRSLAHRAMPKLRTILGTADRADYEDGATTGTPTDTAPQHRQEEGEGDE